MNTITITLSLTAAKMLHKHAVAIAAYPDTPQKECDCFREMATYLAGHIAKAEAEAPKQESWVGEIEPGKYIGRVAYAPNEVAQ